MGWDEDIFKADGVGAQRYKDLLTAWIGGSPWGHSFTHNMYRPSMASWDDYLWHKDYIMKNKQCGLLRGLNTSTSLLDISVGPRVQELPKGCVQMWKNVMTKKNKKDGTKVNSFVPRTTMDVREAFLKARQGCTTSYCTVVEAWEGEQQAGDTLSAKRGATKDAKGKKRKTTTTGATKKKKHKTAKATKKKKPAVK